MWARLVRKVFPARAANCSRRANRRRTYLCRVETLEDRLALSLEGLQLFPADNPWNQNISSAPVAANSSAVIANIGASVSLHPDWGDDNPANGASPLYGIPFNIVHGNSTPLVNVLIDNYPDESDIVPVPIPQNAVLEGDYQNGPNLNGGGYGENGNSNQRGDSHLIVFDEDNNVAYELYGVSRPNDPTLFPNNNNVELTKTDTAWHAAQETVWNMKTDEFRTLGATSADAAGLSILAGLARPDEGRTVSEGGQGVINHALRLTLPKGVVNPQYIYPASHVVNDSQASNKLPFGARLRLANTPAVDALIGNMPPESQIVARAMQQYGLIVADIGSAMYVTGASATIDNVDSPNSKLTWNLNDIFASNGLKTLKAGDFEVVDLTPRVTGLSATSGLPGSTITITGQNFSGAAGKLSVLFGGTPANSVTVLSDSQINAVVPSGSGAVDVTVQSGVVKADNISSNPNANVTKPIFGYGTSAVTSADKFTFTPGSATLTWDGISTGNWTDHQWSGASLPYPDNTANAIVNTASVVHVTSPQATYSLAISGGGQVAVGSGASLSVTTDTKVTAGGTLNMDPSGTFSTGGTLTLDSGGSVVGGSVHANAFQLNDGVVSANLSGPGTLTKNTSGTVTLSGSNSYAGGTVINGGTLIAASGGAIPTGTNLAIGVGGAGELASGVNQMVGGINGAGNLRIDSGGDLTANHIALNALVIGGTSGAPAMVTIAPSDAAGNPLISPAVAQSGGAIGSVAVSRGQLATASVAISMEVEGAAPQKPAIKLRLLDAVFTLDFLDRHVRRWSRSAGVDVLNSGNESSVGGSTGPLRPRPDSESQCAEAEQD
jgi:autotransporter-associated beta strand protein